MLVIHTESVCVCLYPNINYYYKEIYIGVCGNVCLHCKLEEYQENWNSFEYTILKLKTKNDALSELF